MNADSNQAKAAYNAGVDACNDFVKNFGWECARDWLNQQVKPGVTAKDQNLSFLEVRHWTGFCDRLAKLKK